MKVNFNNFSLIIEIVLIKFAKVFAFEGFEQV